MFLQGALRKTVLIQVLIGVMFISLPFAPARAHDLEPLWGDVIRDVLTKLKKFKRFNEICLPVVSQSQSSAIAACMQRLERLPYDQRKQMRISAILAYLEHESVESDLGTSETLDAHKITTVAAQASLWLLRKYGLEDRAIFSNLDPQHSGSYRLSRELKARFELPRFPKGFDPHRGISLQDEKSYSSRKWGGLRGAAQGVVYFSKLGEHDTLRALEQSGFKVFYKVTAPYSERGSKTLLAFREEQNAPTLVFYGFVSEDLMNHKLMQLARDFRDGSASIEMITSGGLKSWQVADLIIENSLRRLPPIAIDDLFIGYPDVVMHYLSSVGAQNVQTVSLWGSNPDRPFAKLKIFRVRLPNGLERVMAVFSDIEYRYFGSSLITLVNPFLSRGIDRVIFAGSAGGLDPKVPVHSRMIPREFHVVNPDGSLSERADIWNEAYSLLPIGQSVGGKHISVEVYNETPQDVRKWRDEDQVSSVDVEGAPLALKIAEKNKTRSKKIRFAAVFIKTDTPRAEGEQAQDGANLADPDFIGKDEAKRIYAEQVLGYLLGFPVKNGEARSGIYPASNHSRIITQYLANRLGQMQASDQEPRFVESLVNLAVFRAALENRLKKLLEQAESDRRISSGLIGEYRNLIHALDQAQVPSLAVDAWQEQNDDLPELQALHPAHQRIVLLQSLTRSASISSGNVGYNRHISVDEVKQREVTGALRAVRYLMENINGTPRRRQLMMLHRLFNQGVLNENNLGVVEGFNYNPLEGEVLSSHEEFRRIVDEVFREGASAIAALQAFQRYEQLHPSRDGNGRVAEAFAQAVMLAAFGHPLLFPNRFDIDYILSLHRNGAFAGANHDYLHKLMEDSWKFSRWLERIVPAAKIERSSIHPATGLVHITLRDGHTLILQPIYLSDHPPDLERESRPFFPAASSPETIGYSLLDEEKVMPLSSLRIQRNGYTQVFQLYSLTPVQSSAFAQGECDAALARSVVTHIKRL